MAAHKGEPIQTEDANVWLYRGFIVRKNIDERTWEAISARHPNSEVVFSAHPGEVETVLIKIDNYWAPAAE